MTKKYQSVLTFAKPTGTQWFSEFDPVTAQADRDHFENSPGFVSLDIRYPDENTREDTMVFNSKQDMLNAYATRKGTATEKAINDYRLDTGIQLTRKLYGDA
jgi:hypothetical protein